MGTFQLWLPDAIGSVTCTPKELGRRMGFKFISSLTFESDKLLERVITQGKYQKISNFSREYGKKYRTEIETHQMIPATIKWIGNKVGFGLFTNSDLPNGTFVGEYLGMVRHNDRRDGTNDYLFGYPILDENEKNLVIDGRPKGNHCRFINHHTTPNLKAYTVFDGKLFHIILAAVQEIKAGEQLCFDYGAAYWEGRESPIL